MKLADKIKANLEQTDAIDLAVKLEMAEIVYRPLTQTEMIDLGAPDVEFCSSDQIVEEGDWAQNPEVLAIRKEREQGGPLALCRDSL
jgi:hypothetical protein